MYLGNKNFSNQARAFKIITHDFAYSEKDEDTRDFLNKIIITAHNLIKNKIRKEDIDFDIYDIVTTMVENERVYIREYLENLDPDHLNESHYITLDNVLSSILADLQQM